MFMKKFFLFAIFVLLFSGIQHSDVLAFCAQNSDCDGGVCQDGECVSAAMESSQTNTGGSSSGAKSSAQLSNIYAASGADQRCMTKTECINVRKQSYDLTDEQAATGFYSAKDHTDAEKACKSNRDSKGNELGFCSPVGRADTQISFGGKRSFENLGEFIQYIYKYSILIAAVLSVFMIIMAGMNWLTSAGNAEGITSAKKKISGAMVGLLIAILSYNILNLLNPYTVNMRLPQIWILKEQTMVPKLCPLDKTMVSFVYNEAQKKNTTSAVLAEKYKNAKYDTESLKAKCASYYFLEGGGDKPCAGAVCDNPRQACVYGLDNKLQYQCVDASLAGRISASLQFICSDLEGDIFDNNLLLIAMCPDGDIEKIADLDLPDSARSYAFPNSLKTGIESACGGKPAGFYLGGEINDEGGGWFGRCPGSPGTSGCDDWHAIGQSSPGKCDLNLGSLGYKLLEKKDTVDCNGSNGKDFCSCGTISDEPLIERLSTMENFTKHLISRDQLLKGFQCDIVINRSEFPALDNSCTLDDDTDCWDDQNST